MRFKFDVKHDNVRPVAWYAMGIADEICKNLFGEECVITSLNDGEHSGNSKHYTGEGIDIRTRHLSFMEEQLYYLRIATRLEPLGYDIVLESSPRHIHIEYDPKQGESLFKLTD